MVSHLNNRKNIFWPLFCHFLPDLAILLPPTFSGHEQFLRASFQLFGRKFNHLPTVFSDRGTKKRKSFDLQSV
jgi:hypothetical protein